MDITVDPNDKFTLIPTNTVSILKFPDYEIKIQSKDRVQRLLQILSALFVTDTGYNYNQLYNSGEHINKHIEYLANYLSYYDNTGFQTKTIIVEHEYMSLSFLKDYANYYTLGYHKIPKYCKRVHFFGEKFDRTEFLNFITSTKSKRDLFKKYYGNVVIKPLPNSLIGPSLIKSYEKTKNREFPALREYNVNLFGKSTKINTLMFQEQDRAISACATVALWMCFNKISDLFSTNLPAPSDITRSAGLTDKIGRSFPTTGLEVKQIISAIDHLDEEIVSEVFTGSNKFLAGINRTFISKKIIYPWKLKRYIYAYLRLEIPPLIGYTIAELNGNHLVTITGYRKEKETIELKNTFPQIGTGIKCEADRIQRLFSHDDQLGPFSKIGFGISDGFDKYIKVNWRGQSRFDLAVTTQFIVPISNFIRITYIQIEEIIDNFQDLLREVIREEYEKIIWDIFIIKSNKYKEELILKHDVNIDNSSTLYNSLPQYIWVAKCGLTFEDDYNTKVFVFDLIFDATDTTNRVDLLDSIFFSEKIKYFFSIFYDDFRNELETGNKLDSFNKVEKLINLRPIKLFFEQVKKNKYE